MFFSFFLQVLFTDFFYDYLSSVRISFICFVYVFFLVSFSVSLEFIQMLPLHTLIFYYFATSFALAVFFCVDIFYISRDTINFNLIGVLKIISTWNIKMFILLFLLIQSLFNKHHWNWNQLEGKCSFDLQWNKIIHFFLLTAKFKV